MKPVRLASVLLLLLIPGLPAGAQGTLDELLGGCGVTMSCPAPGGPASPAQCVNNDVGNQVTNNYVLTNSDEGSSWSFAQTLSKTTTFGLAVRGAYSYGVSRTISDPESTAATSFARNSQFADPNNPGVSYSLYSPGHRVFALVSYTHEYLSFGATSSARLIFSLQTLAASP